MNISFSLSALCRTDSNSVREQAALNKTLLKNPSSIKMRERDSYRGASRENGGGMCALPSPASPPEHIMKDATHSLALFFFFRV